MVDFTAFLVAVGPVALMITKVVDGVRDAVHSTWRDNPVVWNALALGIGVVYAVALRQNLVGLIPSVNSALATGTTAYVLSGLAIGGAAAYWHAHLAAKPTATGSGQ